MGPVVTAVLERRLLDATPPLNSRPSIISISLNLSSLSVQLLSVELTGSVEFEFSAVSGLREYPFSVAVLVATTGTTVIMVTRGADVNLG